MGIELATSASGQFNAGIGCAHRLLVGASARHHVVRVGDGDDSTGERNIGAACIGRIPLAIPAQMVLCRCPTPVAEPALKRHQVTFSSVRVRLQYGPFILAGAAVLVQDLGGNVELADVMEQRCPVELLVLGLRQAKFLTNQRRVRTDAFAVASRQTVMACEQGHQVEQVLVAVDVGSDPARDQSRINATLGLRCCCTAHRGIETRRRSIGKT